MNAFNTIITQMKQLETLIQHHSLKSEPLSLLKGKMNSTTNLLEHSQKNQFQMAVLGTMKSGKSSFVNALLGTDLMPNESAACTLVPVEVTLNAYDGGVEKHFKNGKTERIKGKNIEEVFHQDVKNYRTALDNGEEIDLVKYSVHYPLFARYIEPRMSVKIIDTSGPNEMKKLGRNEHDVQEVFLQTINNCSHVLFVLDIQYYKDEENKKLIEQIRMYRPELMTRMTFILNKADRFMTTKEVSLEDTIEEVKNSLKSWGVVDPQLFTISSKKALLGRIVKQFVEKDDSFLQKMRKVFSKPKSPVDRYKDELNEVLPLLTKKIQGESLQYKPKPEQYYEELITQSNLLELESFLTKQMIEKADSLFQSICQEKLNVEKAWLEQLISFYKTDLEERMDQIRSEEIYQSKHSLEEMLVEVEDLKKDNIAIQKLHKTLKFDKIADIVQEENKYSNRFSSSYLPSYTTGWVEYRSEDYIDPEDTTPGHDRKRLESYYHSVVDDLISSLERTKRNIMSAQVNQIKEHLQESMAALEKQLQTFAKKHDLKINPSLARNCSLMVNDQLSQIKLGCPSIYIETKYKNKERAIFKGLGPKTYRSFRLTEMSQFKSDCREKVESTINYAVQDIQAEIRKVIDEQIALFIERELEQYANNLRAKLADLTIKTKVFDEQLASLLDVIEGLDRILDPIDETAATPVIQDEKQQKIQELVQVLTQVAATDEIREANTADFASQEKAEPEIKITERACVPVAEEITLEEEFVDGEVVEPLYVFNRIEGDTAASLEETFGYMNRNFEQVISPIYESATYTVKSGLIPVKFNGKWSFANIYHEWVSADYDDVWPFSEGFACVKNGDHYGYIDKRGMERTKIEFTDAFSFTNGLALTKLNGKYGFINTKGEKAIDYIYDDAGKFSEGNALVKKQNKYAYINRRGELITNFIFEEASSFSEGFACVKQNGKYGYINQKGSFAIPPQFDKGAAFSEGYAGIAIEGKHGFVAASGEVILLDSKVQEVGKFSYGMAAFMINEAYGYINNKFEVVIEPDRGGGFSIREAFPFQEGFALVKIDSGFYMYVNQNGEFLGKYFEYAQDFDNGMAYVEENWRVGYINQNFEYIWEGGKIGGVA